MTPDLSSVYDDAMKLPLPQRYELISRLQLASVRKKTPGLVRRHFGSINSGDPDSGNNEKIDADLAREYGDPHEPEN